MHSFSDRFGDDLCQELLSYLSLEDKFRFECISKQWQRLVFGRQTDLTFVSKWLSKPRIGHVIESIGMKCRKLSSIKRACDRLFDATAIHLMTQHFTHLTAIDTEFLGQIGVTSIDRVNNEWIKKWIEMCGNLESISFSVYFYPTLQLVTESRLTFKRFNSIHFDLTETSDHVIQPLDAFADKYGHQMKTIRITITSFTDAFFTNIGHNLPKLQYLDVKFVKISDESLISLSGLSQIRGITLTGHIERYKWSMNVSVIAFYDKIDLSRIADQINILECCSQLKQSKLSVDCLKKSVLGQNTPKSQPLYQRLPQESPELSPTKTDTKESSKRDIDIEKNIQTDSQDMKEPKGRTNYSDAKRQSKKPEFDIINASPSKTSLN
ncbi:unnamed protein product [Medioppia subpectinata]|uniref:F-box domain-containing protein n=1 Tax=Medioppia subpectinata TaxID=1979941 RepID=A0A7R9PWI1_9ACAR|nr:unnamed protein product [Medioppia subpectinata]CAG2103797.1 unnamed protein product [Medioppia subpectinata]